VRLPHVIFIPETTIKINSQPLPQEIPSLDTLWFEHTVAKKLWGDDYLKVLGRLACEPVETRDQLLANLYYGRHSVVD